MICSMWQIEGRHATLPRPRSRPRPRPRPCAHVAIAEAEYSYLPNEWTEIRVLACGSYLFVLLLGDDYPKYC